MSRRTDELERRLAETLARAQKAERGEAEVSGANGQLAAKLDKAEKALARTHQSRDEAWKRATDLERQLAEQGELLHAIAEQNRTLIAALEAMAIEDLEAGMAS